MNNHFNNRRDYNQRNQQQNNRYPNNQYQNNQYGAQTSGYNQNYNNNNYNSSNSYGNYPPNQYNSYNQNYQSYSPRYNTYQPPQQQFQYNQNNYNQQQPHQYQYNQQYNQQYSNIPPNDFLRQPQGQFQSDQDYMNSKLIDFRGRLREYIPYAAPRRAIVNLYTGSQSEDWLIHEFIQNIKSFIEYKAFVTFLYNIHAKMTYKSQILIEAIVNNYESILKTPEGYSLFSKIAQDVSPEILSNIAKWCFDSYLQYHKNEPEYINLLSVFVQVLSDNPSCYLNMINLDVYLNNPSASLIGCSIIDNCSENVVYNFLNEINSNLSTLINDKDLIELVILFLVRVDKNVRDNLFNAFYQEIDQLIAHSWKWKICKALLNTVSMSQKFLIAEKVCRSCTSVRENYMDELIYQSLIVVTSDFRLNSLFVLLKPIADDDEHPLVNDFLKNINYASSVS